MKMQAISYRVSKVTIAVQEEKDMLDSKVGESQNTHTFCHMLQKVVGDGRLVIVEG